MEETQSKSGSLELMADANNAALLLDLYPGCDVCSGEHLTEECPELGLDAPTGDLKQLSKARLTLPSNILLLEQTDGYFTLVAQEVIPAKTQFGPFEARRTTQDIDEESLFIFKVLNKEGTGVFMDTSSENECNWMCLVLPAGTSQQQNCIAYQLGTNIFYSVTRDIQQGEELRVWYATNYAKKIGKPEKPNKDYKGMLTCAFESKMASIIAGNTVEAETSGSQTVKYLQHGVAGDSKSFFKHRILSIIHGGDNRDKEYNCSMCSLRFDNQMALAKHLRAHLLPNTVSRLRRTKSKFFCQHCNIGFVNKSNHQRHMKRHKGKVLRCLECGYKSYRLDVMWNHMAVKHNTLKGTTYKPLFEYEQHIPENGSVHSDSSVNCTVVSDEKQFSRVSKTENNSDDMSGLQQKDKEVDRMWPGVDETNEVREESNASVLAESGQSISQQIVDEKASKETVTDLAYRDTLEQATILAQLSEVLESNKREREKQLKNSTEKTTESCSRDYMLKEDSGAKSEIPVNFDCFYHCEVQKQEVLSKVRNPDEAERIDEQSKNDKMLLDTDCKTSADRMNENYEQTRFSSEDQKDVDPTVECSQFQHGSKTPNEQDAVECVKDISEKATTTAEKQDVMTIQEKPDVMLTEKKQSTAIIQEKQNEIINEGKKSMTITNENEVVMITKEQSILTAEVDQAVLTVTEKQDAKIIEDGTHSDSEKDAGALKQSQAIAGVNGKFSISEKKIVNLDDIAVNSTPSNSEDDKLPAEVCTVKMENKNMDYAQTGDTVENKKTKPKENEEENEKSVPVKRKVGRPRKKKRQGFSPRRGKDITNDKETDSSDAKRCIITQTLLVSPSRILPPRRLKGIRTTGNKALDDKDIDELQSPQKLDKPGCYGDCSRLTKSLKLEPRRESFRPRTVKKRYEDDEDYVVKRRVGRPRKIRDWQPILPKRKVGRPRKDSVMVKVKPESYSDSLSDYSGDEELMKDISSDEDNIEMLVEKTSDGVLYACSVCGKRFRNVKYLKLHAPAHTDKFRCQDCNKRFTRKESLQKHRCENNFNASIIESVEAEKIIYTCGECGKVFTRQEYAKRHYAMHTDTWKCEDCGRQFSRRHLLSSHICANADSESKDETYKCDICEQSFRTVKYLYRHLAMHTDIFKCQECGRCFSRKDSMQKHILRCDPERAAAENIHSCHNCGRTFSTKLGLENHLLHCFSLHCFKCRRSFSVETDLKDHECIPITEEAGKDDEGKTLSCLVCHKVFANLQYLHRHEATHKGLFSCDICSKGFSRNEELIWHKLLCMGTAIIKRDNEVVCDRCDKKFDDPKAYRDHYQCHTHPFGCDKCGKRFVKRGSLQTHTCHRLLEGDEARCEICYKTFRSEKYLLRHQIIHGEPQFQCEVCRKKFYRKDYLNDHSCKMPDGSMVRVVRRHNQVFIRDNLICHLCGKSFVSVSNLNKHLKCHGEKTCECDICGKRFHYVTYLKEHKAAVHENKYQHQCAECGKIVKTKTSLVSHMKQFHSDAPPTYACKTCGKVFRQKGNMKTHMFSHSQEKHFKCSFCSKKFKYPDQLNRHTLEHTMTNKLECEHCGKKFVKGYELRKHVQVFHSGLMYVCCVCQAKCGHRHTVIRHYKRKHPEKLFLLKEPGYLNSLLKQTDRIKNEVKEEPYPKEETIITLPAETSIEEAVATAEALLPQMAAEALHSLSSTMFVDQGDTVQMPDLQAGVDGSDQHTVVILQFVNQSDTEVEQTIVCEQEATQQISNG